MLNPKKNILLEYEEGDYFINEEELRDSLIEILNKQGWTTEELVDNFFNVLKNPLLEDFSIDIKEKFYNEAMEGLTDKKLISGEYDTFSYDDRNKKY